MKLTNDRMTLTSIVREGIIEQVRIYKANMLVENAQMLVVTVFKYFFNDSLLMMIK